MNLILLDYDLSNQEGRIRDFFKKQNNCQVYRIKEGIPADHAAAASAKGIVLTALNGGWMKYHAEITKKYPLINHWVFCVVGVQGAMLRESIEKQFAGIMKGNAYCELVFADQSFSALTQKLVEPVKAKKKCLIVSLNDTLAEAVKAIVQEYLQGWTVEASAGPNPDYALCDSVFVVGDQVMDMIVKKPTIHSIKVCFWMNTPYFKGRMDTTMDGFKLGTQLNAAGWNIGDYSSLTFFSSLHHEQVHQQICREMITPAALLADPLFVLWDDYGLPLVQSQLEEQDVRSFIESHTVFQEMIDQYCNTRKGENRK